MPCDSTNVKSPAFSVCSVFLSVRRKGLELLLLVSKKSSTFAYELIGKLIRSFHNLLVISFSVINYVVSMRRPRASGEVSFFLYAFHYRISLIEP